jgi:hypothetical protein
MVAFFIKINEITPELEGKVIKDKKYPAIAEVHIKHFNEPPPGHEQTLYEITDDNGHKLMVPRAHCTLLRESQKPPAA